MHRSRTPWLMAALAMTAALVASGPALAQDPEELEIGFVPSLATGALVEDIQPLADYLSEALGMPVKGKVTSSYPALVTAMQTGQTHVGALPPLGMVQAVDIAGAEVILQSVRFGSPTYHTQFFTNDPDKYCADEPVVNERREAGEVLPFLNCNGTDRPFDGTHIGPIGLDALRKWNPARRSRSRAPVLRPDTSSRLPSSPPWASTPGRTWTPTSRKSMIVRSSPSARARPRSGSASTTRAPDAITDCDVSESVVVFAYGPEIPNDGIAVSGDLSDGLRDRDQAGTAGLRGDRGRRQRSSTPSTASTPSQTRTSTPSRSSATRWRSSATGSSPSDCARSWRGQQPWSCAATWPVSVCSAGPRTTTIRVMSSDWGASPTKAPTTRDHSLLHLHGRASHVGAGDLLQPLFVEESCDRRPAPR